MEAPVEEPVELAVEVDEHPVTKLAVIRHKQATKAHMVAASARFRAVRAEGSAQEGVAVGDVAVEGVVVREDVAAKECVVVKKDVVAKKCAMVLTLLSRR